MANFCSGGENIRRGAAPLLVTGLHHSAIVMLISNFAAYLKQNPIALLYMM